jgi:hypothetical protein
MRFGSRKPLFLTAFGIGQGCRAAQNAQGLLRFVGWMKKV